MPRFLLSVHARTDTPSAPPSAEERQAMMDRIGSLEARMREADALRSSVRLADADQAVVVDATSNHGAAPLVTDGPYLETKELVGGFYVVDAESRDAAVEWATETSRAIGMPIEVRAFLDHRDE